MKFSRLFYSWLIVITVLLAGAGSWTPASPNPLASGATSSKPDLSGFWQLRFDSKNIPKATLTPAAADVKPEYEAFVYIGFDDAAKDYVCHWVDVFGAKDSELGRGKLDDKLFTLEFKFGKDGELTNEFTFDPQTKTWTSVIRQIEKGEWTTFAEEKWTKK